MYRSSIPKSAREHVVERYTSREKKRTVYILRSKIVGMRLFRLSGELLFEYPLKNGFYHGTIFRWGLLGRMLSSKPYVDGEPHGISRQWSDDGKLLGTYTMTHGTGIEFWWTQREDGTIYPMTVRYMQDGQLHGFSWRINEDGTVFDEFHWVGGDWHGIERNWNRRGLLHRNSPRYYIRGEQVTKRQYERACADDPSLPKFRKADNEPKRKFPPEVAKFFKRKKP
jgi:antitoxin component YwqK of YwqJK toxin-antitoxin module